MSESPCTNRLAGKVVAITGGASGIGRAAALRMLAEGASVVVGDIDRATADELAGHVIQLGWADRFGFRYCDTGEERDVRRLVRYTVDRFGRLDGFINNAAISGVYAPLLEVEQDSWDRTLAINLRGVFFGVKHAAQQMISQGGGGSIINVASVAGRVGSAGGPAYTASKGGVVSLTQSAACQLGPEGIRVNAVSPGLIMTPLTHHGVDPDGLAAAAQKAQPLQVTGSPEMLAPTFAYLVSDDSQFTSGEYITVDGGACARGGLDIISPDSPWAQEMIGRAMRAGVGKSDGGEHRRRYHEDEVYPNIEQFALPVDPTPRVVAIAGVSRGLGLEAAREFARLGHTVVGCARSGDAVKMITQELGPKHRFSVVDVSDDDAVAAWAQDAIQHAGPPDMLLNIAAVGGVPKQLWRTSPEDVHKMLTVNVSGTINTIRHFVPAMIRNRRGTIINFSSGWGRRTDERVAPYAASKWGVEALTGSLSKEVPPQLAAVSLHPGNIQTDMMQVTFGEATPLYPTAAQWARIAVPYMLEIDPFDNGCQLAVPGMCEFRGIGKYRPQ